MSRTFKPFSVSSLAAQPPVMPDPTTMASNCVFILEALPNPIARPGAVTGFDRQIWIEAPRNQLVLKFL